MLIRIIMCAGFALLVATSATAQGFFLPTGDVRSREDLTLLADEGVIHMPLNAWPVPRADVVQAVSRVEAEDLADPALRAALARVRKAANLPENAADWRIREVSLSAGEPGLLRDYATAGRENGEITSRGGATTDRYSIQLGLTGALDASDGQDLRLDGSEISVRLGNWIFGANQLDRWWGPGSEGSLILSSNARPMPALSIDRIHALPLDLPVLRWFGPWRLSAFLAMGENDRSDVQRPAFLGMRLSFKPVPIVEFGLSRSAQFCGRGRDCGPGTLWRVLIGQDNRGIRGLDDPEKEPGNQMAGADVRIVSPFKPLPLAVHAQLIGEDNSSTGIPERYLASFGGETWFMLDTGSVLRAHIEYANTKAKWYQTRDNYNVAYRQQIFFAGYRYRGRNIGHPTDSDSETTSVGMSLTTGEGQRWAALFRRGRLDWCCGVDVYNTVSVGPSRYRSLQLSWDGAIGGNELTVQLGHERQTPDAAGNADGLFGFLRWHRHLN